ncbi:unnamed protein product [Cuscuta campestris]|uniref:Uncharacterized protein n=1 Tax=Cuscuta campestris TaxID=132261 RepID=A0A484KUQ4_9ASTE|nr:unnamed protein product [Cuscuta campestris]
MADQGKKLRNWLTARSAQPSAAPPPPNPQEILAAVFGRRARPVPAGDRRGSFGQAVELRSEFQRAHQFGGRRGRGGH